MIRIQLRNIHSLRTTLSEPFSVKHVLWKVSVKARSLSKIFLFWYSVQNFCTAEIIYIYYIFCFVWKVKNWTRVVFAPTGCWKWCRLPFDLLVPLSIYYQFFRLKTSVENWYAYEQLTTKSLIAFHCLMMERPTLHTSTGRFSWEFRD